MRVDDGDGVACTKNETIKERTEGRLAKRTRKGCIRWGMTRCAWGDGDDWLGQMMRAALSAAENKAGLGQMVR